MSAILVAPRKSSYPVAFAVAFHETAILLVKSPSLAAIPVGATIANPTKPVSLVLSSLVPAVKSAFTVYVNDAPGVSDSSMSSYATVAPLAMSAILVAPRKSSYPSAFAVAFHETEILLVKSPSLAATPDGATIANPTKPVSLVLGALMPAVKRAFTEYVTDVPGVSAPSTSSYATVAPLAMSAILVAPRKSSYPVAFDVAFHETEILLVKSPSLAATPVGATIANPTKPVSLVLGALTPAVKSAFTV